MGDTERPTVSEKPKKKPKLGRQKCLIKERNIKSHVTGESCNCKRLKCFENTTEEDRTKLLDHFNSLKTKDEQDAFLYSLVSVHGVKRRRSRKDQADVEFHDHSYKYHINIVREGIVQRLDVCINAFLSVFGIKKGRVERIRQSLGKSGLPPTDMRGQHHNRPHAFSGDDIDGIIAHIRSFRGRKSHYSRRKSSRLYLPEDLNITKMYRMCTVQYPLRKCSYESYRGVFNTRFNISFGYPRKDTCSTCDELQCKLDHIEAVLRDAPPTSQAAADSQVERVKLSAEKELHLRKAEVFYDRKATARKDAQQDAESEAIAFDFQKNLPCPNITTNDVYYARQLSFYSFNIHVLATNQVFIYCYDETVARKGADEVCSMLFDFFPNHLAANVKKLSLFCDSCAGQNRNWSVLRFMHYCVHNIKMFEHVTMTFPIRGHSYMECDKDMAHVNQKAAAEIPSDWQEILRAARVKPSAFNIINMTQEKFCSFSGFLRPRYLATCPIPTRPIRELSFSIIHPQSIRHRENWNGPFSTAVVTPKQARTRKKPKGPVRAALPAQPEQSYTKPLLLSTPKYKDLQKLKRFCSHQNQQFYDQLQCDGQQNNESDTSSASDNDVLSD